MKNTYNNEPLRSARLAGALNRPGIEIIRYGLVIVTPVQDRFFEISKWKGAGMEPAANLFRLGMSVSAYGSIRVPRVASTS